MIPAICSKAYWSRVWDARHFLICLVRLDLRNRYRRSMFGLGWSLMNPIFMAIILCAVFHRIFNLDLRDHAPFVVCGLGIWNFLSQSILEGGHSLYNGEKYIRSCPMPMAIYPLRSALVVGFHFLILMGLAFGVTLIFKGYANPIALISLLPSLVICFAFAWALGVIFGFANIYFPDTQQIVTVVLQMLYFLTPIFYPPGLIKIPVVREFVQYNPLAAFVDIIRDPMVYSRFPSVSIFSYAALVSVVSCLWAVRLLQTKERTIIFHM